MVVPGILFSTSFEKWLQFLAFADTRKWSRGVKIDWITVLLEWLIKFHYLLRKFQRDHQYLGPWLHQPFLIFCVLWLAEHLQIEFSLSSCFFGSCYSLIECQNYLVVLTILKQVSLKKISVKISEPFIELCKFNKVMSITIAFEIFAVTQISSIFGSKLFIFKHKKRRPLLLKTFWVPFNNGLFFDWPWV